MHVHKQSPGKSLLLFQNLYNSLNEGNLHIEKTALNAYNVLQSNHFIGAVMAVTSVRLQPEIENPLEDLSKKLDRSKNYLINQAIKEFIARKNLEEQRWAETLEAIDSVKSGNLIEEREVNDWLESWGTENELEPPNR